MRNRRNKRNKQNSSNKVTIITSLCIIIGILFFSVIFSLINMGNSKIINGIKIYDVDISNLTRRRSKSKNRRKFFKRY